MTKELIKVENLKECFLYARIRQTKKGTSKEETTRSQASKQAAGKTIWRMVKAFLSTRVVTSTKAISRKTRNTGLAHSIANSNTNCLRNKLETKKTTCVQAREPFGWKMDPVKTVIGSKMSCTEKVVWYSPMEIFMKVNTSRVKELAREYSLEEMETTMKATGSTIWRKAKAVISMQKRTKCL